MDQIQSDAMALAQAGFRGSMGDGSAFWSYMSPDHFRRHYMTNPVDMPDIKDEKYQGEKGEEQYFRDLLWYYIFSSTDTVMARHAMWRECENMYNRLVVYGPKDPGNLEAGKEPFPATNSIFQIVERRAGEFASRPLKFKVTLTNQAARSRKEEFYNKKAVEEWMKINMPNTMEFLGEGLEGGVEEVSKTEESLTPLEHRSAGYRDYWQESAQKIMNDFVANSNFDRACKSQAREYQKTNCSFFFSEVNPATLQVDYMFLRPEEVFFDPGMQDDFGKNCQFAGFFRYYPVQELQRRYPDIKQEEWQKILGQSGDVPPMAHYYGYGLIDSSRGVTNVLVMRAWFIQVRWRTYDEMDEALGHSEEAQFYNKSVRREAAKILKELMPNDDAADLTTKFPIEEVFEVVMIGDHVMEYGPAKNQVRSVDAFAKANLPIKILINDYQSSTMSRPRLLRVRIFEQARNTLWLRLQDMLGQLRGDYTVIDPSKIANTINGQMAPHEAMQALIDSQVIIKKSGDYTEMAGQNNDDPIKFISPGQSASIQMLIMGIDRIDQEINRLTSNNAARSGTSGQYASPDVTAANKTASDLETYLEDTNFVEHLAECATQAANMEKMAISLRRKRNIMQQTAGDADLMRLGDLTYGIAQERFTMEDLGVKIDVGLPQPEMRQLLVMSASRAMENGHLDPVTWIEIQQYSDLEEAMRRLKFEIERGREREQQQIMQQQQMQMQMQEQQMQASLAQQQQQFQHELQLQEKKEVGKLASTELAGAMSIMSAQAANQRTKKDE